MGVSLIAGMGGRGPGAAQWATRAVASHVARTGPPALVPQDTRDVLVVTPTSDGNSVDVQYEVRRACRACSACCACCTGQWAAAPAASHQATPRALRWPPLLPLPHTPWPRNLAPSPPRRCPTMRAASLTPLPCPPAHLLNLTTDLKRQAGRVGPGPRRAQNHRGHGCAHPWGWGRAAGLGLRRRPAPAEACVLGKHRQAVAGCSLAPRPPPPRPAPPRLP